MNSDKTRVHLPTGDWFIGPAEWITRLEHAINKQPWAIQGWLKFSAIGDQRDLITYLYQNVTANAKSIAQYRDKKRRAQKQAADLAETIPDLAQVMGKELKPELLETLQQWSVDLKSPLKHNDNGCLRYFASIWALLIAPKRGKKTHGNVPTYQESIEIIQAAIDATGSNQTIPFTEQALKKFVTAYKLHELWERNDNLLIPTTK